MQNKGGSGAEVLGARYRVRRAAGLYWLIDIKQSGNDYISPVPMNELGAKIWDRIVGGASDGDICLWLCKEYDITKEQASADLEEFKAQLRGHRVDFGGAK